ncbi:MAG TPA: cytoplasmic protein [Verrucomicrobiae bacterium]|nr:cytoplasmic protein [Verrucomicrobiae bacterium]
MPPQFRDFTASELYCPKCKVSQPVRERLLLVLPSGELYEYLCSQCATTLGKRTISGPSLSAPANPPSPRKEPTLLLR